MKKLLYLFIASTILLSCESNENDDNEATKGSDPIIGEWQLHQIFEDGKDTTTDCMKKSIVEFKSDGTYKGFYNRDCERENINGTWKNNGNSSYTNTNDGELSTSTFNFENNNNTYHYTSTNKFDGKTYTYKEVWNRRE